MSGRSTDVFQGGDAPIDAVVRAANRVKKS